MAIVVADRVKVRSLTTGTGPIALGNPILGFQGFEAVGDGNQTYYVIIDLKGNWEVGRGTYSASTSTLSRDSILDSSNSGSIVNFEIGLKEVYVTLPASVSNSLVAGTPSDSFSTISVAGQSNVVADSSADTLTLVAGDNITITTNPGSDTITISSTGSAGGTSTLIEYDAEVTNRVEVGADDVRVRLNTQLDGNLQTTWTFGTDGTLTVPGAIYNPTNLELSAGSADVEFLGYIDNGLGGSAGATLHVTSMISGTIADGMTIYGPDLPEEGWTLEFGTVVSPQGTGGVGNYYLPGANYLTTEETFTGTNPEGIKTFTFNGTGSLTFPDGSVQPTAFTGGSVSELNDEENGNKVIVNAQGDLVFTDASGTLEDPSGGGWFRGLKWDYGAFNGGADAEISSGDGVLVISAGGTSEFDDAIILRTGVNGVTTVNDWLLAGTNLTLPNEAVIKSNVGSAGAGNIVTLATAIGDTTPGIDNTNVLDGIPTTFFDTYDWIGGGTMDPIFYPTITFADGTTTTIVGVNTDAYGDNGFLEFADTLTKTGSEVWPITITSYDYVAAEGASVGINVNGNEWKFNENNKLVFPDGTEQTTAYVTSVSSPLFVAVNASGETAWSTDGEAWTVGSQLTLNGTGPFEIMSRVAVADSYITYIGYDLDADLGQQLWSASNYNTNPTLTGPATTGSAKYEWNDIEHGGNYTVAVGAFYDSDGEGGNVDPIPVFAYTQNGTSWTVGNTDPNYQTAFTPGGFKSVWYGNSGWLIVASGGNDPEAPGAGAFWVTDPTQALDEGSYVTFDGLGVPPNISSVVYTGDRWWVKDDFTDGYFVSDGANPQTSTWSGVDHVEAGVIAGFGTPNFWEDAGGTIGTTHWFAVGSNDGHVLASSDGGETWVASVPLPYTGTIGTATEATPCKVTFSGPSIQSEGEKIVISNADPSAYNGTYYAKYDAITDDDTYELYEDAALTTPVDSTAFGTFVSADVLFTHGQYIDALGFGLEKFIVGNDSEQLFVSTDLETWTKVNDQNDDFAYWDDISFNANWGAGISVVSRLTNGNYSLQLSANGATTLPGALIVPTDYPADGTDIEPTALALNKQVQVLDTANEGNRYSLADGVEGQIMYFVPATNSAHRSITIVVANARTTTGIDDVPEINDIIWNPFIEPAIYSDGTNTIRSQTSTIAMAIFTDGAWNLQGGWWD